MVTQPLPRSPASGPLATLTSVSSAATCAQMYLSVLHYVVESSGQRIALQLSEDSTVEWHPQVYEIADLLLFSKGTGRGRRMHARCCGQSSHEIISQLVQPHHPTQPAAGQACT